MALGQATDAVQKAMVELGAPATLSSSFQGTAQAFQQSLGTVPLLILAALVVVYLILGILYESYIHPITILSTLPSAGVGALAILMAVRLRLQPDRADRHHPADRHRQEERHHDGRLCHRRRARRAFAAGAAIRQAALLRFRPIMMTTMAALLGGVPLMLGTGTGSEIRQPLGYAMVGGLIVSQALTLFTTPVVYLYLDRLSNAFAGWGRSPESDGTIAGAKARSNKPPNDLTLPAQRAHPKDVQRGDGSVRISILVATVAALVAFATTGLRRCATGARAQGESGAPKAAPAAAPHALPTAEAAAAAASPARLDRTLRQRQPRRPLECAIEQNAVLTKTGQVIVVVQHPHRPRHPRADRPGATAARPQPSRRCKSAGR